MRAGTGEGQSLPELTLTLRRRSAVFLLLGCLGGVAAATWMFRDPRPPLRLLDVGTALFMGSACTVGVVIAMIRLANPWELTLDRTGVSEYRPPFRPRRDVWQDCGPFEAIRMNRVWMVVYLDPRDRASTISGYYGRLSAAELAELLNHYREAHGAPPDEGPRGGRDPDTEPGAVPEKAG